MPSKALRISFCLSLLPDPVLLPRTKAAMRAAEAMAAMIFSTSLCLCRLSGLLYDVVEVNGCERHDSSLEHSGNEDCIHEITLSGKRGCLEVVNCCYAISMLRRRRGIHLASIPLLFTILLIAISKDMAIRSSSHMNSVMFKLLAIG